MCTARRVALRPAAVSGSVKVRGVCSIPKGGNAQDLQFPFPDPPSFPPATARSAPRWVRPGNAACATPPARLPRCHGQALLPLLDDECRQVDAAAAGIVQLPRTRDGHPPRHRQARQPRRRRRDRQPDRHLGAGRHLRGGRGHVRQDRGPAGRGAGRLRLHRRGAVPRPRAGLATRPGRRRSARAGHGLRAQGRLPGQPVSRFRHPAGARRRDARGAHDLSLRQEGDHGGATARC